MREQSAPSKMETSGREEDRYHSEKETGIHRRPKAKTLAIHPNKGCPSQKSDDHMNVQGCKGVPKPYKDRQREKPCPKSTAQRMRDRLELGPLI